ncbi:IS3 family transposase [Sulfobacillus thermosulfidooxidans]|uniref:IS3 family transposase n=1 Tax=Sulfobacillus thermosulfidooxidans TaxID=28034 RepID=UPI000A030FE4|nr:IS3 family transposase [Sulfobacillus thermosulfidooxidans]
MSKFGGRNRYVWTANDTKVAEGQVLEWLSEFIMAGDGQAYGYRKLTTWLRREHGLIINKKTVYRLLRSADLLQGQPLRPSGNRPPRVLAANRVVTGPNQLWEMDLKYGYIAGEDRFFISAVSSMSLIDAFWRIISDLTVPLFKP